MPRTMREAFAMSCREIMNAPDFDWTRNRRMRRWLAAAYMVLSVVAATVFGIAMSAKNMWLIGGFVLLMPAFLIVIGSMNASIRGLTEIRTAHLDEWQIARRDTMFRMCWWPGVAIMTIAGFVAAMTAVDIGIKAGMVMGAYFITMCLPTVALVWTLPEEPEA